MRQFDSALCINYGIPSALLGLQVPPETNKAQYAETQDPEFEAHIVLHANLHTRTT
jgi:hypothetical protein